MSMTEEERRVAYAVVDWLRIAREAGFRAWAGWPSRADVDHSGLLRRLLHGGPIHATVEEYRAWRDERERAAEAALQRWRDEEATR